MNTAPVIKTVVNWWKILNVKSKDWFNNKLQAVLQDPFVKRLNTIPKFGEMALKIKGGLGKHYSLPQLLFWRYIAYVMVLPVCIDLYSESPMFY